MINFIKGLFKDIWKLLSTNWFPIILFTTIIGLTIISFIYYEIALRILIGIIFVVICILMVGNSLIRMELANESRYPYLKKFAHGVFIVCWIASTIFVLILCFTK